MPLSPPPASPPPACLSCLPLPSPPVSLLSPLPPPPLLRLPPLSPCPSSPSCLPSAACLCLPSLSSRAPTPQEQATRRHDLASRLGVLGAAGEDQPPGRRPGRCYRALGPPHPRAPFPSPLPTHTHALHLVSLSSWTTGVLHRAQTAGRPSARPPHATLPLLLSSALLSGGDVRVRLHRGSRDERAGVRAAPGARIRSKGPQIPPTTTHPASL